MEFLHLLNMAVNRSYLVSKQDTSNRRIIMTSLQVFVPLTFVEKDGRKVQIKPVLNLVILLEKAIVDCVRRVKSLIRTFIVAGRSCSECCF